MKQETEDILKEFEKSIKETEKEGIRAITGSRQNPLG